MTTILKTVPVVSALVFGLGISLCVHRGPIENVLKHIEKLSQQTRVPVRLKYRLKCLDRIEMPKKFIALWKEVMPFGFISSKMPQTSFRIARDICSLVIRYRY